MGRKGASVESLGRVATLDLDDDVIAIRGDARGTSASPQGAPWPVGSDQEHRSRPVAGPDDTGPAPDPVSSAFQFE